MNTTNHPVMDLTGEVYGRLTVLGEAPRRGNSGHTRLWDCRCSCGKLKRVQHSNLRGGRSLSCGCLQKERASDAVTIHGFAHSPIYIVWQGMRARCNNPKNKRYNVYGGRGIKVCAAWDASFEAFLKDMGPRPSDRHSIERIDNDKGYSLDNCKWLENHAQARHRSNNRTIEYHGETRTLVEWAEHLGIGERVLNARINNLKWGIDRAFTTPTRSCKPRMAG